MAKKGKTPKSPKFKANMKREAEKNQRKPRPSNCKAKTMKELLGK